MLNSSIETELLQDIFNYSDIVFLETIKREFHFEHNGYDFDFYIDILRNIKYLLEENYVNQDKIIDNIKSKIYFGIIFL